MNLTEWARQQEIHPQTAYRWLRNGTMPVPIARVNSRSVLVFPDQATPQGALGFYALARMNAELVEASLSAQGRRLVVLEEGEVEDDLVRDMVEVLTSFCARRYGRRGARHRATRALRCAEREASGESA